ncbi:MAG: lipopolysaccharide biosynthesis protein [Acidobacteriota bacterium]|nr:lipopolysaccharide biosynthesis protein [Acidobacteriota bacterium]
MLTGRELNVEDYIGIFRRRIWLLIIPAVLGPVIGLGIAHKLSPRYTSTSQILIDEPKVPTSFVPSTNGNNLISRLANMEEQIRSRSRLQPIMERYGLYRKDINKVPIEELVARMNKAIVIMPVEFSNQISGSAGKNQVPGFQISFTADTPQVAQGVCQEITSMFIDANLRQEEARASGTADFIAVQLQGAKQKLDEQDAKLAAFKRQYFGSLPDQEQTTIQLLGTLSTDLNSLAQTMSGYQQQRTYTESLLAQQAAAWKAAQNAGGGNPGALQEQLNKMEDNLTALRAHYTDDYPDVIKAKADIAALKQKLAQQNATQNASNAKAGSNAANPALEPPQIHQLRASLSALDGAITSNQAEQNRLRKQIAANEGRLKLTPAVEEQFKDLTRNYQTASLFYNSLLQKEDESQMSTSLARRQEGQQFTVLDPADLPQKPSFPNHLVFAGGGLAAGIVVGVGLILLMELKDKSLHDEKDIEFYMGAPTLAMIPMLGDGNAKRGFLRNKLAQKKDRIKTLVS